MRFLLRVLANRLRHQRRAMVIIVCFSMAITGFGVSVPVSPALAQDRGISFIRDTEIENTIRFYLSPIYQVAGVDASAVSINIIQEQMLNAFVAGGQRIFINTGLLMRAETPDQVIGVLAHELGHITGGHLSQFKDAIENAQAYAIAGLLLGIGGALATGDGQAVAAGTMLGRQGAERSFLSYSRANEQAADQAAVTFLDDAGISSQGMVEFMTILKEQDRLYSEGANPYTRTHPLTQDRINFLQHHVETSRISDHKLPEIYNQVHDRMRAKLLGYINPQEALNRYPEADTSVPARYARAIAYMQLVKQDKSLEEIDSLLAESPDDPFFWETKGDIMRTASRLEEAAVAYRKAVEILPWAALIRVNLAQVLLEQGQPDLLQEALDNANVALSYEPDMIMAWNRKGEAHQRRGDTGMAYLCQAEVALRRGEKAQAQVLSQRAMENLPENSASWLQAQDISYRADDK